MLELFGDKVIPEFDKRPGALDHSVPRGRAAALPDVHPPRPRPQRRAAPEHRPQAPGLRRSEPRRAQRGRRGARRGRGRARGPSGAPDVPRGSRAPADDGGGGPAGAARRIRARATRRARRRGAAARRTRPWDRRCVSASVGVESGVFARQAETDVAREHAGAVAVRAHLLRCIARRRGRRAPRTRSRSRGSTSDGSSCRNRPHTRRRRRRTPSSARRSACRESFSRS